MFNEIEVRGEQVRRRESQTHIERWGWQMVTC